MKKNHLFIGAVLVIFLATILTVFLVRANREWGPVRVNPAFREYVQAFTSGIVSTRTDIKVRLTADFADTLALNMPLNVEYFRFKPAIKGKTYWSDSRTLVFRPEERLPQDQEYKVEFFLSGLLTLPDSMKTMVFQFRTMRQEISAEVDNHKAYSHRDLSKEHLNGKIMTSDVAEDSLIEKILTASQMGRDLPVSWTHDQKNRIHLFQVDSIIRGNSESEVKLKWDGSEVGSESEGELVTAIPALSDFKMLSAQNFPGTQQSLVIRFSDPLSSDQNLDGLFRVGSFPDLRYTIEDNLLFIYLPETTETKVQLKLEPSIRNINQKSLDKRVITEVIVDNPKPNIRFVGDGVIMPSSNGMLLPFEAVNLKAVDVKVVRIYENNILQFLQANELSGNSQLARVGRVVLKKTIPLTGMTSNYRWNRYSIDLSTLMKTEAGAIYSVTLGFKKEYSTYPCGDGVVADDPVTDMVVFEDPEIENDKNWDYFSSYDDNDWANGAWRNYVWEERDNPCKPSYFFNKSVSRNVLASDLGIIAKAGNDGTYHVFVTDIITTKPLSGISVEFFNFQLQSMAKATTNGEGMAIVPMKKRPFIVVAGKGDQAGYLKLTDGNALSLSMFDVSGEPVQKGLKGFIYGERGVWRPGDSIFLAFILEDKMHQLPPNHPVSMSLINPSGQLITRMVRTNSANGFYNFSTATPFDAPTGNWLAKVNVGGAEFQKVLKIETVKPNRLKINFDFKTDYLVKDKIPPATLGATWLTGATAGNLKAKVSLTLTKSATAFKTYPGYVFDDPTAGFAAENITLFDGRLDATGRTTITPSIHVTHTAPGALRASFETMVFEAGGDFSIDRFTIPYYPYNSYAGLNVPQADGGDRVLYTDKTYNIDLINLDAQGALIPSNRLKVAVYKLEWRWWWDDSEAGSADFISTSYIKPSDSATVNTVNGKAMYAFRADHDNWGRYLVKVTDRSSGHSAGKVVYVDWPGYFRMPGGEKQAAAMLTLTTDKSSYKVGEKARLTLPTSPDGRALVTIESGTAVLKSFWVPTNKGTTDISFETTEAMSPNCYAYVTLIQPHAQTKNDLPVRLYGVIPVQVENLNTHLQPVITMNNELEPGKEATILVKEKNGKAMSYTIAMVDEGLLDLTRFKTPDPWKVFNAREALGVKTWDLFDQVMGAYSGELQRILSIGGDEDAINKEGLKANRFKPMVKFFGPFELKKGQSGKQSFIMPEYIGSVRIMVIAGHDGAYGKEEKTVAVKKQLMVLGTLPRVVGPGETVVLPVTIFAMNKSIREVKTEVRVNEMFTLDGAGMKSVTFSSTGDQLTSFTLNVAEAVGIGRVTIVATSGSHKAEQTIEIGVRNPNPAITNVVDKAIYPAKTWTTEFRAPGIRGSNKGTLEISDVLPMNLEERLSYLIHYPYGCVEQTVSSVFPQLYLGDLIELTGSSKKETEQNIRAAISRLKSFQLNNGGFSSWPGSNFADDWGTSYAGHFLLEAEKKGYTLPVNFLSSWKEFQRQKSVSWGTDESWYNSDLMQSYRLYTLALAKSPELGAMNKLLEKKNLSVSARWRLAAAYELAGKREVAVQLVQSVKTVIEPYNEPDITYGSDLRDKAMIVEALSLLGMKTKAAPLVKEISASLCTDSWYSTQTTAFALLALTRFSEKGAGTGIQATLRLNSAETEEIGSGKSMLTRNIEVIPGKKGVLQVINNGKSVLYARLILSGIPATGDTTETANNLKISVVYKSVKDQVINPRSLEQGTNFIAEVTVSNPGMRGTYKQLALSQRFPSGWEIINARSSDLAQSRTTASAFDYQDVRDDRVYTFFDLNPGQTKTFRVMLMATYQGSFYLPVTTCEAMYDNTISAHIPGRWVSVVAATK